MVAGPVAAGRSRTRGHRDAETPFRKGSIGEVCLFTHPRAQLNAARPRPSALLTTASQARHAPRLAPYLDAQGLLPEPYRAWILVAFATQLELLTIFSPCRPNPA